MTDDKQLDHLIGVLYESALDPGLWREVVKLCGHYAGGVDAHLLTIDKKHNTPITSVVAGTVVPLESGDDYANHYIAIDPRHNMIKGSAVAEWLCCHHSFDQNFVDHNEFYQDFFIYYGVRYAMIAWVDDTEDDHSVLGVVRAVGQQPFGHAEQQAARRFSGHLQRTLRLQKHTQNLHTKAELGARAIDALAMAMLIVDGNGVIRHLNAGAEHLLNSRVCGLTMQGRPFVRRSSCQQKPAGGLGRRGHRLSCRGRGDVFNRRTDPAVVCDAVAGGVAVCPRLANAAGAGFGDGCR